ncbi:alpha/beta hydrolase [Actinoplanes sp. NPDC049668]|uniref:alpha/beta hydrolase n=1 Tax=unclassified Actinoplanes TaxID=2626549 RepID=UPI0033AACDBB
MSAITLGDLLTVDPETFRRSATEWQGLAEDIDNAAEQLIRDTRSLEDAWPQGPASRAAYEKAARLRAELSNAYPPARRIYQALLHHADAVADLRHLAQELMDAAGRAGFRVDKTTGAVSAPEVTALAPGTDPAAAMRAYADEIAALLGNARALDDSTANAITVNMPDPRTGFGSLSLAAVSRDDLLAQKGRDPKQVHAWWLSLTPEQQEAAIAAHPDLVGWLDGVPATDRDTANRLVLGQRQQLLQEAEDQYRRRIAELEGQDPTNNSAVSNELANLRQIVSGIDAQQGRLGQIDAALTKLGDKGLLLGVDPIGDGKAVIAVGNPDTARHTAVWVPGLGTTLDSTHSNVNRVINLQQAADAMTPEAAGDVSTVMWLGYDAPELDASVALEERSRQGSTPLSQFVGGLRATHDPGDYHLTAMGHSYGSTVVGEAALSGRLQADDIVTAGSPGTHADNAGQLMADPRHVWSGSAADDPVSKPEVVGNWVTGVPIIGPFIAEGYADGHGISPHEPEFGANQYVVDTAGHSAYWTPGSQSLQNQAAVIVGRYSLAGLEHGQAPPNIP